MTFCTLGWTCLNQLDILNRQDGAIHIVELLNGAKHVFILITEHFLHSNPPPETGHSSKGWSKMICATNST